MWSTGEGNGNPLQCFCVENPMDSIERPKETPEDKSPGQKMYNMLLGKSRGQFLIAPEKNEAVDQSQNDPQLQM